MILKLYSRKRKFVWLECLPFLASSFAEEQTQKFRLIVLIKDEIYFLKTADFLIQYGKITSENPVKWGSRQNPAQQSWREKKPQQNERAETLKKPPQAI